MIHNTDTTTTKTIIIILLIIIIIISLYAKKCTIFVTPALR